MTAEAQGAIDEHSGFKAFFSKFMKDNVGFLASAVAWSVLTSIVPIMVGLLAISGFVLRGNTSAQKSVVQHVSQALQGVLTSQDIQHIVQISTQHAGVLGIVGFLGILWGGSNVGGSISTVFQPIFQVKGRNFFKEKLIDIVMIFVLAYFLIVIIVATTAGTLLTKLFSTVSLPPGIVQFVIGIVVAVFAAFLLFAAIYLAFPNVKSGLKMRNVWPGAILAAVLFEILTFIFPIYSKYAHFQKYGSLLAALLLLTAWIYFFAMITLLGAEMVSFQALKEASARHEAIGPAPDGSVPQRMQGTSTGQ
ncbi:MAG: hypothetical protein DLM70_16450 [Chloroflexi bacterium]|nr:MAG: hypothetical protein DLM70_16450 [Chloroflexota bacterium]